MNLQKQLIKKDSWEENFIINLKDADLVPWGDNDAFYRYPKYSHIYDKYLLTKVINSLKVWDLEKEIPTKFPVIVKPKVNLFGLGKNSYVADNVEEIEDCEGLVAQEFVEGTHYSTDFVLDRGKIIDSFTFIGNKNYYGDFILWESIPFSDKIKNNVEDVLPDFTGICNFESIDGNIIEGHLRGSLQFFDICGGMLEQMPKYFKSGDYTPVKFEKTYSKVLRTRHDGLLVVNNIPKKVQHIRSVQLCFEKNTPLSATDPNSFRKRYCVVNSDNVNQMERYSEELRNNVYTK